jgi:hypothetical protein
VDGFIMLTYSFLLLLAAVVLGAVLAIVQLRSAGPRVPWPAGALHALLGASGTAIAALAPAQAAAAQVGTGGFRGIGVVLLCLALAVGLVIIRGRILGRRLGSTVVGVHALLAISGVVVLGAYLAVG